MHLAAGAAAVPAVSRVARAQAYPTRTVTIIVPVAAGGTPDVAARIIGEYMSRLLGQQFIVENVTGAGGTIGSTRAMRARPDGYTIMMGHTGTHAFSVAFYPNLAYRPDVDFEPIGQVLEIPELIVAQERLSAKRPEGIYCLREGERRKVECGARWRRLPLIHLCALA